MKDGGVTFTFAEPGFYDDRYRIDEKLGKGGMATVYRAFDQKRNKILALKIISLFVLAQNQSEKRFEHEFKIIKSCSHPSVIKAYDLGKTKEGLSFYTMEYLPWDDLGKLLGFAKKLPAKTVHVLVEQIARAFIVFHSRGLLHRDLKPSNLLVSADNRLVITDFGLAKSPTVTNLTDTGQVFGSPSYMSPEQFEGRQLDLRSDIFQLGAVCYEMLTGRKAFDAQDLPDIYNQVLTYFPPPSASIVSGLSPRWDHFIERCMAKKASDRFANGREVLDALQKIDIN